jgi:divalent metal cation (Fe/Co/Zn/Cd) transporter
LHFGLVLFTKNEKALMTSKTASHQKTRLLAISLSLALSLGLMALKFYAYWLTNSSAILS